MPDLLHGNAVVCDLLSVDRMRKVVDVNSVYLVMNVVEPKFPPLVPGGSHSLAVGRKCSENDVLVPLDVYCLSIVFGEVASFVHNETEVVRILAGLNFRLDEVFVTRSPGLLSVTVVLLNQSLPRHLFVPCSNIWPLPLEGLDGVLGGARCG